MNIRKLINLDIPLILASASPRRKQLLSMLNIEFKVEAADIDEDKISESVPEKYCVDLAFQKAGKIADNQQEECIVLGADTIVVLDHQIINKPKDNSDAYRILELLSNKTHQVYTAIVLIDSKTKKYISNYQVTEVTFRALDPKEIWAYIETGSPLDKAGAYGIQDDFGALFVKKINGCYYNIVGLPLEMLYTTLQQFLKSSNE